MKNILLGVTGGIAAFKSAIFFKDQHIRTSFKIEIIHNHVLH